MTIRSITRIPEFLPRLLPVPRLGEHTKAGLNLCLRMDENTDFLLTVASGTRGTSASMNDINKQQIRFCTSDDGTRIAYAVSGEGPPLVKAANWLTHIEFDWDSFVWRHWFAELSRDRTLVRYDERGCGLSDGTPRTCRLTRGFAISMRWSTQQA